VLVVQLYAKYHNGLTNRALVIKAVVSIIKLQHNFPKWEASLFLFIKDMMN